MTTIYVKSDTGLPERHENDKYVTEKTLVDAATWNFSPVAHHILDIGAADGRWGLSALRLADANCTLTGVEIEDVPKPDGFTHWFNEDFLTWKAPQTYDLIVSNPPYFLAEPVIRKAWDILTPGGTMLMLLRLSFMEGVKRYTGLWRDICPVEVAVVSRRPSFSGNNRTNATAYGVYVWEKYSDGVSVGKPRTWKTSLLLHEREA